MDILTFLAEVINALAWPVAVIIAILVLRRPLSNLIPLLQRLKYRDLVLEFGAKVEALALEAKKEVPTASGVYDTTLKLRERFAQLARFSPRAVILEAWLELEVAAVEAIKKRNPNLTSREMKSPILLEHALGEAGILDNNKLAIFRELRILRNAATHAFDFVFDSDSAIEYADTAVRLATYMQEQ